MPQIKMIFGKMDQDNDPASKDDSALAMLYNGYRVGNSIHGLPALEEFCDIGTGNVEVYTWYSTLHSSLFAVSAGSLYRISTAGIKTAITGATLDADAVPVFTEDSGNVFVAANSAIYKISGVIATAVGGQSPINVNSLTYVSGFILADGDDPLGGNLPGDVWYSDDKANDYQTWEVFNNESVPDEVQSIFATYTEIFAVGKESYEVSDLSSDPANPFYANKAASQPFGTPARYSVAFDQQSIYFLSVIGQNRCIVRMVGGRNPQIISFPISVPIDSISDISGARAFIAGFRGQAFYVITFPDANINIDDQTHSALTLAFSIRSETEEWYLWGNWDGQKGEYSAFPVNSMCFVEPAKLRLAGGNDGKVYSVVDITRDDSPVMRHRWRNDGKERWNNPRTISLGALGDRKGIKRSLMCGQYYKRQDEFIFSDSPWRTAIRTGWRSWGKNAIKTSLAYVYDIKCGDGGFVLNSVEENVEVQQ